MSKFPVKGFAFCFLISRFFWGGLFCLSFLGFFVVVYQNMKMGLTVGLYSQNYSPNFYTYINENRIMIQSGAGI